MTATAVIVFARMDSVRLAGKVLADLCGRPLLGRVLDRVRKASEAMPVILATSDREIDDPVAAFAAHEGVTLFRGDCDDVAGRALACCDHVGIERFVRISGDSPFMPPELIDQVMAALPENGADLLTNVFPRTWPAGASVEVITTDALKRAHSNMSLKEREHVTSAFYSRPEDWRIVNLAAPDGAFDDMRLTVDTGEELEIARAISARLGAHPERASLEEVVSHLKAVTNTMRAEAL